MARIKSIVFGWTCFLSFPLRDPASMCPSFLGLNSLSQSVLITRINWTNEIDAQSIGHVNGFYLLLCTRWRREVNFYFFIFWQAVESGNQWMKLKRVFLAGKMKNTNSWLVRFLLHINPYRLFKAKSCLYIY